MNQPDQDGLSAAIAPNIFDAYLNPDLLLPLVLGNLMSQRLWDFSARIQQRLDHAAIPSTTDGDAIFEAIAPVREIQRQIDRHFKHLHPSEVAQIYGELNLTEEGARLGQASVSAAIAGIKACFNDRMRSGAIPGDALQPILDGLEHNRFPGYCYANFDVVRAGRQLTGRKSKAPMGLTSCLDEVSLFAALVMTLPRGAVESVIALSCVSHYTAFGWSNTGAPWWFYGKSKLLTEGEWKLHVAQDFAGDAQAAFDQIFKEMDRVTSAAGTFDLRSGQASIEAVHIDEIVEKLDQFFGVRLRQISDGLSLPRTQLPEAPLAPILRELLGTQSIEQARNRLLKSGDPRCLQVLYSYRSLDVPDHKPYLEVALSSPNCKKIGSELTCQTDAIGVVQGVEGCLSIFDDRNRIAMPDETLRMNTGSDRDKALLLHALLVHYYAARHQDCVISTLMTAQDSFVCGTEFCLSLNTLAAAGRPTDGILITLSMAA